MKLIDMHCDTIWKLMDLDQRGNLAENDCSISILGMKTAGTIAQFFACFTYIEDYIQPEECIAGCPDGNEAKGGYEGAWRHCLEMIEFLEKQALMFQRDIALARSYRDLRNNEAEGKISAFLTVEEGGVLNGRMERLEELYERGVRLITPMWNYENCLGHPNSKEASVMTKGLKAFGIETVKRMAELGMIVDVSHASDGTFADILAHAKKCDGTRGMVVASHSNCRALCNHPRNLTDDMIRSLAEAGGIAGLNFYGPFLNENGMSRVRDMTEHILHMSNVGGSEFPAIGTDFDGFDGVEILEISKAEEMEKLWDALKEKGVTERQLDMIWHGNVERILNGI